MNLKHENYSDCIVFRTQNCFKANLIPGQRCVLHFTLSAGGPYREQSTPPLAGRGLVHVRVRDFQPVAQDFEQALHELHWV